MPLQNRNIILAITGGIAAYKSISLLRLLTAAGATVQVILSPAAKDFVPVTTLGALSGRPVLWDFTAEDGTWHNHVDLGLWADVLLIAPCTAHTLGKLANGICDNLLTAVYLSARCPVFIAPAMDLDMYRHPSLRQNMQRCTDFGNTVIPAARGPLASGLEGEGRLPEPETLFELLKKHFSDAENQALCGKRVLITAGPTYEAIDPVRFIGNHSSGKMGFALAEMAAARGASVTLISGPTALQPKHPNIQIHRVTSAVEMLAKVEEFYPEADIAIASAAVADYAPKVKAEQKIKKNDDTLTLELVKNPDILKKMGEQKKHQFLVGFALETTDGEVFAREKLQKKNLDMIVLNTLQDEGAGFKGDTNKVTIITKTNQHAFGLKNKTEVAADILDFIQQQMAPDTEKMTSGDKN